ncbi:Druantia anti-phage system protein DruA [Nocardia sp. CA-120079]|uniref:Druantia anti-phage system protein DruA n=1 Tax=Nocardia sp. CA-120079 TaxID=3239974 RepID=UPI003D97186B
MATRQERRGFAKLCALLSEVDTHAVGSGLDHTEWARAANLGNLYEQPILAAAAHTLIDLVDQGWTITIDKIGPLLRPPSAHDDRQAEKARIRRQEHVRRDEQLRKPSVRRFVESMERGHRHGDDIVSVFNLMRDGGELADTLASADDPTTAIKPYVQIVDQSTCELTSFRLHDIWRYFRHTWSNAYATVPGRSMPILIRDAATKHHAVVGLAAISSPVVQIAERDTWMGWETDQFLKAVEANPTTEIAQWLANRIQTQIDEIYVTDLVRNGVLEPTGTGTDTAKTVARLKADAERYRQKHHRGSAIRVVRNIESNAWVERAETYLFRSKRSAALAEALEIAECLGQHFEQEATPLAGLKKALDDRKARAQIRRVIRKARGERVGTVIADLTVCGAVAPYNALAAGKLVGALAVSPKVLAAYRAKYARPSEIASAMAGRPIEREARLSFVGTTSLYGTGSSQYNRLFWPANVMGGAADVSMGFHELGRSRSFGTSHFSDETVAALVRLSQLNGSLIRVNSIFGEGVSPRLRKIRHGLAALGWPTNELLKHGRERILYGVPLVKNLREFSLGIALEPDYLIDPGMEEADQKVAAWWLGRWALRRAAQPAVQDAMRSHRLVRPIQHGARVPLPVDDDELLLFSAESVLPGS